MFFFMIHVVVRADGRGAKDVSYIGQRSEQVVMMSATICHIVAYVVFGTEVIMIGSDIVVDDDDVAFEVGKARVLPYRRSAGSKKREKRIVR